MPKESPFSFTLQRAADINKVLEEIKGGKVLKYS